MVRQLIKPKLIDASGLDDGTYALSVVGGKVVELVPGGGSGGATERLLSFKRTGALAAGIGATRFYNDTETDWVITGVRASVETDPSGGAVVIDVNINDTTIFTTQSNRPTIAAGTITSGRVTSMDVTSVPAGSYLTIDVDTATAPSANLTVQIGVTA